MRDWNQTTLDRSGNSFLSTASLIMNRLKSFFARYFLTQDDLIEYLNGKDWGALEKYLRSAWKYREIPENAGYVLHTAQHFLYGLTVCKKKTRLVIPIELILAIGSIVQLLSLLQCLIDFSKTNWIEVLTFYISLMTPVVCSLTILIHRKRIRRLSDGLDAWWNYPFLQNETQKMKRKVEFLMNRFNFYYFTVMYIGAASCGVLPFQKSKFSKKKLEPSEELMVPMWMPFSIEGNLGFIAACSVQVLVMWFAFFTFGRTCSYLICVYVTIGYQMKLIGIACQTKEERGKLILKKKNSLGEDQWQNEYEKVINTETNRCIIHYQKIYSFVEELSSVYSLITNLTYHAGMWGLCLLGVRFVREIENPFTFAEAASAIVSLFFNQYLYSHMSEAIADELADLRLTVYTSKWYIQPHHLKKDVHLFQTLLTHIPTLRTIMGTKTNMENLGQILNAAYYYFSMIISLR